ncbi:MAG: cobalt-precorrin-5B (C(1))-methyltransferase, partial [Streptosporangiaceae bacterium]
GRTEQAAMALLPGLPEVCFIEVGDFTGAALRQAAAHGVRRVVFAGMAGKLAKLAGGVLMTHYTRSKVPHDLLAEITRMAGGSEGLAAQVEAANSARHAAELWDEAGLLAAAGTELCRHAADVLSRFYAEVAAEGPAPSHDEAPPAAPAPAAPAPAAPAPAAPAPAAPAPAAPAPAAAPAGPAPSQLPSLSASVRVIMIDFSGRAQLAAYPPEAPERPETPA